jgi:hypothetical protein
MLVVGTTSRELASQISYRQTHSPKVIEELLQEKIVVHTVAPPVCSPALAFGLKQLSDASGGVFHPTRTLEEFESILESTIAGIHPGFTIRYRGFDDNTPPRHVKLLCHCPQGIGETTTELTL